MSKEWSNERLAAANRLIENHPESCAEILRDALAEIERLQGELEKLKTLVMELTTRRSGAASFEEWLCGTDLTEATPAGVIARLQARVAELEADKERLDSYEAMSRKGVRPGARFHSEQGFICWEWANGDYPTLRAAIDAAIKQEADNARK